MNAHPDFITEMSKSEVRELGSRLSVIIEHLLKLKHVKGQIGRDNLRGWKKSVRDQQNHLADLVSENPRLKPQITDVLLDTVYRSVIGSLNKHYAEVAFPSARQLSVEDIVGSDMALVLKRR